MALWWKILTAAGAGTAAFFIFVPRALATEDETGETVPPSAPPAPPAPRVAPGTPDAAAVLGQKAVEVLSRDVGAREAPPGSNRGPVVDRIVRGVRGDGEKLLGKPWCALAVKWAFERAAQELCLPPPFAGIKGKLAAVTDWRDAFKGHNLSAPKPGAVALILDGKNRHATIVSRVEGDRVETVEGNHWDAVAFVRRPKTAFAHFLDVEVAVRRASSVAVGLDLLGSA